MITNYTEFWDFYVLEHSKPMTRVLHFIGTSIAMGCVAVSPFYPPALIAAPIAGYGFAWVGHFMFEKNKPASWGGIREFAWSLRGDLHVQCVVERKVRQRAIGHHARDQQPDQQNGRDGHRDRHAPADPFLRRWRGGRVRRCPGIAPRRPP